MTPRQAMDHLSITPELVQGISVGDWHQVVTRIQQMDAEVNYVNNPRLRVGNRVEVLPGNGLRWDWVGQHGKLMEYFRDRNRWGVALEESGEQGLIMAGNLKRFKG